MKVYFVFFQVRTSLCVYVRVCVCVCACVRVRVRVCVCVVYVCMSASNPMDNGACNSVNSEIQM